MEAGELKPILTALVLPPAGPLLLALFGLVLARWRRGFGSFLVLLGIAATFALSTNGAALLLARHLAVPVVAANLQQVQGVQGIVVLGGGLLPQAPEYGMAQPSANTLQRLRYAAWLARRTGKPVGFAGGIGWAAAGMRTEPEGSVARRVLQDDYGVEARWIDDRSRDTAENASRMASLMLPQGARRIAIVTDWSHMPRAAAAFRRVGFEVLEAPTDFPIPRSRPVLEWLPSSAGAASCRELIREWLGRVVVRIA